jgi:hypothetical protein
MGRLLKKITDTAQSALSEAPSRWEQAKARAGEILDKIDQTGSNRITITLDEIHAAMASHNQAATDAKTSGFNVKEFSKSMEKLQSPEDMDEAFAKIFVLPANERKTVGEALEKEALSDESADEDDITVHELRDMIRKKGLAATKKYIDGNGGLIKGQEEIRSAQAATHGIFNLTNLRGDQASPLLKAFADAARKLTPEEYNSTECWTKPMYALVDAIAESEGLLKPNPLSDRRIAPAGAKISKSDVEEFKSGAREFVDSLSDPESPEDVDRIFSVISALPPAQRRAVADALEEDWLSATSQDEDEFTLEDFRDMIREEGLPATKKYVNEEPFMDNNGHKVEGAEAVKLAQATTHAYFNLGLLKGNQASPLLKAFAAAARKLTTEEYNSEECARKPMCAFIDALAKSEGLLKPNPLATRGRGPAA